MVKLQIIATADDQVSKMILFEFSWVYLMFLEIFNNFLFFIFIFQYL
jgi:hypothetical protein